MPTTFSAMSLIDAALRGTVIALLLVLAAVVLRDRPRLAAAQAGWMLALGLVVQVIGSTPSFEIQVPRLWQAPLVGVAVGNAVLFWAFAEALFDDDFVWRPVHVAAWVVAFAVGTANCGVLGGSGHPAAPLVLALQRLLPLACALGAARAALLHWRDDLVEIRRRLRVLIVAGGVVYTISQVTVRVVTHSGMLSAPSALVDMLALLLMTGLLAWRLLSLASSEIFPMPAAAITPDEAGGAGGAGEANFSAPAGPAAAEPTDPTATLPPADAAETRLAQALEQLMTQAHAYRTESLTLAALAAQLAVPEYRLRRHINQRLGHRNFNAYVNGYRLAEAREVLADPEWRERSVLTVALDAGFQSIGPFNRAFKAATGLTPTEYRRSKLAELADS